MNAEAQTDDAGVWVVQEIYDTDAGPQARRVKEVFAHHNDALVYVARLASELAEYEHHRDAARVAETIKIYGRFADNGDDHYAGSDGGVTFHDRVGPGHDIYGYSVTRFSVREKDTGLTTYDCPYCDYIGPLVDGRDPGLMACAQCGAQ